MTEFERGWLACREAAANAADKLCDDVAYGMSGRSETQNALWMLGASLAQRIRALAPPPTAPGEPPVVTQPGSIADELRAAGLVEIEPGTWVKP